MNGKPAIRQVGRILKGTRTKDGAGVSLLRVFSSPEAKDLDPFLLFDAFGSEEPSEYLPGFPRHPHRGMETVTYMLEGTVRHGDSLGNSGTIGKGDLQWMSAGSGIIHEEMPQFSPRGVIGFQLWVNLPRAEKMKDPEYRDAPAASVPSVAFPGGTVKPLAGGFRGIAGPVTGIVRDPAYFDINLEPDAVLDLETPRSQTCFAYVYAGFLVLQGVPSGADAGAAAGTATAGAAAAGGSIPSGGTAAANSCVLFGPGDLARLQAGSAGCSLVFARAEPLHEPIAWGGPIVMNTNEELETAFREYERGTFVKTGKK
ncbi:MAG TPA: pirin family protein [Treponema sp.]|nr:MAG: hypothetical protein A2001_20110 [Treponema sp. GWC1_61_84]OHE74200.1 MAG: hypothetical protein A2413_18775 [Treponema sp. RIFOXYC1_FULL_61_9]HCM25656.1 pirin family protein [Treponema sp.]